jgi:hypothetical protein
MFHLFFIVDTFNSRCSMTFLCPCIEKIETTSTAQKDVRVADVPQSKLDEKEARTKNQ